MDFNILYEYTRQGVRTLGAGWFEKAAAASVGAMLKLHAELMAALASKQIAGAAARGLPWGVYCFSHAQTTERAEEEAQVVIDELETLGYGTPVGGSRS